MFGRQRSQRLKLGMRNEDASGVIVTRHPLMLQL